MLREVPGERRSCIHCCEHLKSRNVSRYFINSILHTVPDPYISNRNTCQYCRYISFELCIFKLYILGLQATNNEDNVSELAGVCTRGNKLTS